MMTAPDEIASVSGRRSRRTTTMKTIATAITASAMADHFQASGFPDEDDMPAVLD